MRGFHRGVIEDLGLPRCGACFPKWYLQNAGKPPTERHSVTSEKTFILSAQARPTFQKHSVRICVHLLKAH